MACTIFLLRHGLAEDAAPDGSDDARALTAGGARKTRAVARGLRRMRIAPAVVLSSPLRRAEETARIVAEVLAPDTAVEIFAPLAPGNPPGMVARGLRAHRGAGQIVLVGHQPDLGELASYLLTGSEHALPLPFKKAGAAAITVSALPPCAPGTLEWFLTPIQLRAIGRRRR